MEEEPQEGQPQHAASSGRELARELEQIQPAVPGQVDIEEAGSSRPKGLLKLARNAIFGGAYRCYVD